LRCEIQCRIHLGSPVFVVCDIESA
jgi:hypothetical protein